MELSKAKQGYWQWFQQSPLIYLGAVWLCLLIAYVIQRQQLDVLARV